MTDTLEKIAKIIEKRKTANPESSYVANLQHRGLNKILEKVGEEATETILAAKDAEQSGSTKDLIHETADLWFHSLVMLAQLDLGPKDVLSELEQRFGISGLAEKVEEKNS